MCHLNRSAPPRFLYRGIGVTLFAMPIVLFGMRSLEVIFFIGFAGSAVVVVMATWEDIQEIFRKTEHGQTIEKTPAA